MLQMTLDLLRCPYCASSDALAVAEAEWRLVDYQDGARREMVRAARCLSGGAAFPVADYVPSFAAALPQDVRADADYWGRYYAGEAAKGNHTYMEPRLARAGRAAAAYDPEAFILRHPLLKERGRCLDLGCGVDDDACGAREGFAARSRPPQRGGGQALRHGASRGACGLLATCTSPQYGRPRLPQPIACLTCRRHAVQIGPNGRRTGGGRRQSPPVLGWRAHRQ